MAYNNGEETEWKREGIGTMVEQVKELRKKGRTVERRDGGLGRRTRGLATDSPEASPSEREIQDHHHEPSAHKARTPRKVFGCIFGVSFFSVVFLFS